MGLLPGAGRRRRALHRLAGGDDRRHRPARRRRAARRRPRCAPTPWPGWPVALGREVVVPADVLDVGVRIATSALAEAGVAWLLTDAGRRVERSTAWHADDDVRRRLQQGLRPGADRERLDRPGADRRADRAGALRPPRHGDQPARAGGGEPRRRRARAGARARAADAAALPRAHDRRRGLRPGSGAGRFSDDDVAFATDLAGRLRPGLRQRAAARGAARAAAHAGEVRGAGRRLRRPDRDRRRRRPHHLRQPPGAGGGPRGARGRHLGERRGVRRRRHGPRDACRGGCRRALARRRLAAPRGPGPELCLDVEAFPLVVPGSGESIGRRLDRPGRHPAARRRATGSCRRTPSRVGSRRSWRPRSTSSRSPGSTGRWRT